MTNLTNRRDFVLIFDVKNGNPNGDPDADNLPRMDPETSHGLVSDVCLKRKVRNYVIDEKSSESGYEIYVADGAVLNNQHKRAYDSMGLKPVEKKLPKDQIQAEQITNFMCKNFFDIRAFGAVMTTEVNSGQVRGPLQFAFAESVDPIVTSEITVTRSSVTNEKDAERERTMGRKHIVPYGLYVMHGYVNARLAEKTGFSEEDLDLVWNALGRCPGNMFEVDRSAARGIMTPRNLIVFTHSNARGNAHSNKLFERINIERVSDDVARSYTDYKISVDESDMPSGVTVEDLIG